MDNNVRTVKVKRVEINLQFDIWDDELEPEEVASIISTAVDKAGYSLYDIRVDDVVETEVEV